MRFEIHTLVDITETNARFSKSDSAWHQQQNYITLLQLIGLRINPEVIMSPTVIQTSLESFSFGKKFKGKHNVWNMIFENHYEGGLTINNLKDDFNHIPVITNLDETIKLDMSTFNTKDDDLCNIIFSVLDK